LEPGRAILLENLRFDPREETNAEDFAKQLSLMGEFYVNEAFATSHREHASIVGIPKFLPHSAGIHFGQEIDNLEKAFIEPVRPVLVIVSGLKEDKLPYVEAFKSFADRILVGGRLPEYAEKAGIKAKDQKVIYADLLPDKEDITVHSVERFEQEVAKAKTIVVAGPLGKFEEPGHRMGTERVFRAIASSQAFKVAGGGDTHKAISLLKLEAGFNWLSVGGGASLEFLAKRTLPGIEALK
jgi:phosphoglycerate kinase